MSWRVDHLGREELLDDEGARPFETDTSPVRVSVRYCAEDGLAHLYRVEHLIDPSWQYLIPVCCENHLYPARHGRRQVGSTDLVGPPRHDMHPSCLVWQRHHAHRIYVGGRVA